MLEIRTVAGPSSVVQCVLSGGPYTVSPLGLATATPSVWEEQRRGAVR